MIILIIILIIIAIPLVIAIFTSTGYTIEREIIINKPNPEVFDFIKMQKNQERYNKWVMLDPNSKKTYQGTDGTVGFAYAWESDNKQVGQGVQEIKSVTEGKRVDLEIRFIKPFSNVANIYMETVPITANQTKVTWGFSGSRPYLHRLMHLLLNLKKVLGNDMQTSLSTLKTVIEKNN